MSSRLRPEHRGLEWGAGRSTLWFATRVAALRSIEHDPFWYDWVATRLVQVGANNVDLRLCPDSTGYTDAADDISPDSLDFVLVDGKWNRDTCALHALHLLRAGGLLIVDNVNRHLPSHSRAPGSRRIDQLPETPVWQRFLAECSDWNSVWTTDGVTDTAIWIKPLLR